MSRRYVGNVLPQPTRDSFQALCNDADCPWTFVSSSEDDAVRTLRDHARLEHPEPIPVYDGEDPS